MYLDVRFFFFAHVLNDLFYLYYSLRTVTTVKATMDREVCTYTGLKFSCMLNCFLSLKQEQNGNWVFL